MYLKVKSNKKYYAKRASLIGLGLFLFQSSSYGMDDNSLGERPTTPLISFDSAMPYEDEKDPSRGDMRASLPSSQSSDSYDEVNGVNWAKEEKEASEIIALLANINLNTVEGYAPDSARNKISAHAPKDYVKSLGYKEEDPLLNGIMEDIDDLCLRTLFFDADTALTIGAEKWNPYYFTRPLGPNEATILFPDTPEDGIYGLHYGQPEESDSKPEKICTAPEKSESTLDPSADLTKVDAALPEQFKQGSVSERLAKRKAAREAAKREAAHLTTTKGAIPQIPVESNILNTEN